MASPSSQRFLDNPIKMKRTSEETERLKSPPMRSADTIGRIDNYDDDSFKHAYNESFEPFKKRRIKDTPLDLMSIEEGLDDLSDGEISASGTGTKEEENCSGNDDDDDDIMTNLLVKRKPLDHLRLDSESIPSVLLGFQGCFYNRTDYLVDELIRKSSRPRLEGSRNESKNCFWDSLPSSLGPHPLADRSLILRVVGSKNGESLDKRDDNAMATDNNNINTNYDDKDDKNRPDFYTGSPRQVATNTHSGKLSHTDFIIGEVE